MDLFEKQENINIERHSVKMEEPQMMMSFKEDFKMHEEQNERVSVKLQADPSIVTMPPMQKPKSMTVMSKLDIANKVALKTREERMTRSDISRVREKENFKNLIEKTSKEEREKLPEDIKQIYKLLDEYNGINLTASSDAAKETKMNILRRGLRWIFRRGKKRKAIRREEESLRDARFGIIAAIKKYGKKQEYVNICDTLKDYLTVINKTMGMIPDEEKCNSREERFKKKGWKMEGATELNTKDRKLQMTGEEGFFTNLVQGLRTYETRNDAPLFAHEPCTEDIQQGALGDCWFLAALASVVKESPQAIRDMMLDNADGSVTVRFFEENKDGSAMVPYYVTVSKQVPKHYAVDCFWVQIMEKAYSAFRQAHAEKDGKTGKSILKRGKKKKKIKDNVIDYGYIDGGDAYEAVENLTGVKGRKESIVFKTTDSYISVTDLLVDKMEQMHPESRKQKMIEKKISSINGRLEERTKEGKVSGWNKMANKYENFLKKYRDVFGIKKIENLADITKFIEKLEERNKNDYEDVKNARELAQGLPENIRELNMKSVNEGLETADREAEIIKEIKAAMEEVNNEEGIIKLRKDKENLENQRDDSKKGITYPPNMSEKVEKFIGKDNENRDKILKALSTTVRTVLHKHEVIVMHEANNAKADKKIRKKIKMDNRANILFSKMKPGFYKEYLDLLEKRIKGEVVAVDFDQVFEQTKFHVQAYLGKYNVDLGAAEELVKEWMLGIVSTMKENIASLPSANYKEPKRDAFEGDYSAEEDEQWEHMMYLYNNKAVMNAGSKGTSDKNSSNGIVEGHAYTIYKLEEVGNCRFVHLRNPHAATTAKYEQDEKTGLYTQKGNEEDTSGVFAMEFSNFCKSYDSLYVNERG